MKNKLILLFIAIALIILVIPANGFVFARLNTAEDTTTTVDDSAVGKIVKLTDYQIANKGFYLYATVTETSMTGGVIIRSSNFNTIPTYFLVQDVVPYSYADTLWYKLTTVDGSTNTQLASTPWIKSLCVEVVGDAPKTVVGATVSFKTATTVFYETISDDGTLGENLFFETLPDEVVIIAIKEVNGVKYYQVALSDGSSDQNFDKLPWVEANDVNIVGFPEEEGVIEGQVSLTQSGEPSTTVSIVEGEKEHIFTQLSVAVGDTASYQWQMKVADNGWALINGYVSPYAVISHALIKNALDGDGYAYIRCIVKDGDKTFVSSQLAITMQSNVASLSLSTTSDNQLAEETCNKNVGLLADGEAFHIRIIYEFLHAENDEISGTSAASVFVITLGSGMYFDETITSPSVLGYKPYVECDASTSGRIEYAGRYFIPADTYKFTNQSIAIEVYIYYIPQEVSFRVKYFRQNLQDDEYTEYKTEFKSGTADTPVGTGLDVAMEGFSALYYDKTTDISCDGNTVVEVYYDRIYYLVKYVLGDGGYGVMPNYVRYGTNVMLGTPSKPGYEFNGWNLTSVKNSTALDAEELLDNSNNSSDLNSIIQGYKNATSANSQITVAHNLVYEAQWSKKTVNYTIIYWLENADSTNASTKGNYGIWRTKTMTAQTGANTIECADNITNNAYFGSDTEVTRDYYFISYNQDLTAQNNENGLGAQTVKGDGTTTVNIYYSRNEYTLRFYYARKDSSNKWYVAGMTDYFGKKVDEKTSNTNDKSNELYLLDKLDDKWGYVDKEPELKINKGYTLSEEISGTNTYKYLSFNAKYGSNIAAKWPIDVFNSVVSNVNSPNNEWDGTAVLMSAWTGEWNVKYQHDNTNQTIKGKYEVLDSSLMWRPNQGGWNNATYNNGTISFLSFWENAINESWNHPELYRYKIWLPTLAGTDYSDKPTLTHDGVTYYLADSYDTCDNSKVSEQTQPSLTGYTKNGYVEIPQSSSDDRNIFALNYGDYNYNYATRNNAGNKAYITQDEYDDIKNDATYKQYKRAYVVNYFYTRNVHSFIMYDNAGNSVEHDVSYGESVLEYNQDPTYPSSFEKNNYEFGGWYQDKACTVDFKFNITMPDKNIQAYAKWVPTTWKVNVYLDEAKTIKLYSNDKVEFGSMIAEPDYAKEQAKHDAYKELIFAGWYYTEEGEDVRFDFNTMAIKRNYEIFAKWTSHIPVEYTVRYVVEQTDGTYLDIAEPTTGVSLAGVTKTFIAKVGPDIDMEYRDHLPVVRSQSKEMTVDGNNEVIFEYKIAQNIEYTIKHTFTSEKFTSLIGKNTYEISWSHPATVSAESIDGKLIVTFDSELYAKVHADTNLNADIRDDVWDVITSLSPDAYQKEIILILDSASNVIEFTWADSGIIFVYQVIHYYQNVDGNGYTARRYEEHFGKYDEITGKATITAVDQTEVGFEFNAGHKDSQLTMEVDRTKPLQSKVLKVYYDRVSLSYTVRHVYGTTIEEVAGTKSPVLYEAVVTETANTYDGFVVVAGQETQSVSITYDGQIIVFNYVAQEVIYNYQVADGVGGSVSRVQEVVSVVALQNQVKGSVPIPQRGYVFVGWYLDESCTISVDPAWIVSIDGNANGLKPTPQTAYANTTKYFYAKFEPTVLVIQNAGAGVADDQVFVYDVTYTYKDTENNDVSVSMQVTVIGKGKVTIHCIPVGAIVTIAVVDSWSWRYNPDNSQKIATIPNDKTGVTVTFTYTKSNDKWLSDSDFVVNLGEE